MKKNIAVLALMQSDKVITVRTAIRGSCAIAAARHLISAEFRPKIMQDNHPPMVEVLEQQYSVRIIIVIGSRSIERKIEGASSEIERFPLRESRADR